MNEIQATWGDRNKMELSQHRYFITTNCSSLSRNKKTSESLSDQFIKTKPPHGPRLLLVVLLILWMGVMIQTEHECTAECCVLL